MLGVVYSLLLALIQSLFSTEVDVGKRKAKTLASHTRTSTHTRTNCTFFKVEDAKLAARVRQPSRAARLRFKLAAGDAGLGMEMGGVLAFSLA